VLYFFAVHKGEAQHTLAAVKMFGVPDPSILRESYGTLCVCRVLGKEDIVVVDTKSLTDVVGMIPFRRPDQEQGGSNLEEFFSIEKMNLMTSSQTNDDNDVDDI